MKCSRTIACGCYAANKSDVVKCACCGGLKLGATEPSKSGEKALSASIGKISFGVSSNEKAGVGDSPIVFGSSQAAEKKDDKVTFDFGNKSLFGSGSGGVAAQ